MITDREFEILSIELELAMLERRGRREDLYWILSGICWVIVSIQIVADSTVQGWLRLAGFF